MLIRKVDKTEKKIINDVVSIHLNAFPGFFLTFMGRGFLKQMYASYCDFKDTGLFIAYMDNTPKPIGFLAYSGDMSGLYKSMLKKRLLPFAWFSLCAFLKKPKIFMRLIRALLKPNESKRKERYVEISSIGVDPACRSKGVGTMLINELKKHIDFNRYAYISLETDAENNDGANYFYKKNGFIISSEFETPEKRKMYEYRYRGR